MTHSTQNHPRTKGDLAAVSGTKSLTLSSTLFFMAWSLSMPVPPDAAGGQGEETLDSELQGPTESLPEQSP